MQKQKDELLEEECEKFISIYKPESQKVLVIKNFLKAYITDDEIRDIINKKEFSRLATNPKLSMRELKELGEWKDQIVNYVVDYVNPNAFL